MAGNSAKRTFSEMEDEARSSSMIGDSNERSFFDSKRVHVEEDQSRRPDDEEFGQQAPSYFSGLEEFDCIDPAPLIAASSEFLAGFDPPMSCIEELGDGTFVSSSQNRHWASYCPLPPVEDVVTQGFAANLGTNSISTSYPAHLEEMDFVAYGATSNTDGESAPPGNYGSSSPEDAVAGTIILSDVSPFSDQDLLVNVCETTPDEFFTNAAVPQPRQMTFGTHGWSHHDTSYGSPTEYQYPGGIKEPQPSASGRLYLQQEPTRVPEHEVESEQQSQEQLGFEDSPQNMASMPTLTRAANSPQDSPQPNAAFDEQEVIGEPIGWKPVEQITRLRGLNEDIHVRLHARVEKGVVHLPGEPPENWGCYRRNYFQVACGFEFDRDLTGIHLYVHLPNGRVATVQSMGVRISAHADDSSSKNVELVRFTAKRDNGPKLPMKVVKLAPSTANVSSTQRRRETRAGPILPLQGIPEPDPADTMHAPPAALERRRSGAPFTSKSLPSLNSTYTFERIQFKNATANNGKRRASQQYFVLKYELLVDVRPDGSRTPEWVQVAYRTTEPLIVRGRSPNHYHAERQRQRVVRTPVGGSNSSTVARSPAPPMIRPFGVAGASQLQPQHGVRSHANRAIPAGFNNFPVVADHRVQTYMQPQYGSHMAPHGPMMGNSVVHQEGMMPTDVPVPSSSNPRVSVLNNLEMMADNLLQQPSIIQRGDFNPTASTAAASLPERYQYRPIRSGPELMEPWERKWHQQVTLQAALDRNWQAQTLASTATHMEVQMGTSTAGQQAPVDQEAEEENSDPDEQESEFDSSDSESSLSDFSGRDA